MSKLVNILKNTKTIGKYVNGVINARRTNIGIYELSFVKEDDGIWYIDLPNWTGAHASLAMVAGSDLLLDHLLNMDNRVNVEVIKSEKPLAEYDEATSGYFRCEQIEMSMLGGATYNVFGVEGFNHTIWICPVTLFVLGEYPKFIYIRQLK